MDMMRELAALLFAAVLAGPSVAAEFYVAPDGDEGNDGLAAKPVKILQRALDLTHKVEREEDEEIVRKDSGRRRGGRPASPSSPCPST